MLPFTADQFFAVFRSYNQAIWPAHLVAYALSALVVWGLVTRRPWSGRAALLLLAVLWLWNGLVYHGLFFAPINTAAYGFAVLFVVQGLLFLRHALHAAEGPIAMAEGWRLVIAAGLAVYALVLYGVLGTLLGHGWPRAPVFGVAPCPTTIFTFAVLIVLRTPLKLSLIPLLWAAIGTSAAVLLGVKEDFGLAAAGLMYLMTAAPVRGTLVSVRRGDTSRGET